jgi:hypothetical protein
MTDYSFIDPLLTRTRRLFGDSYFIDEALAYFNGEPRYGQRVDNCEFESYSAYARKPGLGLKLVEEYLGCALPQDLKDFYEIYDGLLLVTQTDPLYLLPSDLVLEATQMGRESGFEGSWPMRTMRFAAYNPPRAVLYLGLWNSNKIGETSWLVHGTDINTVDQHDDLSESLESRRIMGTSFSAWLKRFVESDGRIDPYGANFLGVTGAFPYLVIP